MSVVGRLDTTDAETILLQPCLLINLMGGRRRTDLMALNFKAPRDSRWNLSKLPKTSRFVQKTYWWLLIQSQVCTIVKSFIQYGWG